MNDAVFMRRAVISLILLSFFILGILFLIYTSKMLLLIFSGIILSVPLSFSSDILSSRFRIPRPAALLTVSLLLIFSLLLFIVPAVPLLYKQAAKLMKSLPVAFDTLYQQSLEFPWTEPFREYLENPVSQIDLSSINLPHFFSGTLEIIAYPLIIFAIAVYLASDPSLYVRGFLRLFPVRKRGRIHDVLRELNYILRWWLFGQSISMLILGISTASFLYFMDVPMALFLGILTAAMTFIPNLGPVIAGVPTVLTAFTVSPATALIVFLFYVVLQNIEGFIITPNIHSRIISMPPVLILSAQVLLAVLTGIPGVILAMPLVAVIMVLIRRLYIEDVLNDFS